MQSRAITEGALFAAITVLLAWMALFISLMTIFLPIPLAIVVYRHGAKTGIVTNGTAAIAAALLLSSVLVPLQLIISGLLGFVLGLALRERFGFVSVLVAGTGAWILSTLLLVFSYVWILDVDIIGLYLETWERTAERMLETWTSLGVSSELLRQYEQDLAWFPDAVRLALPALLVLAGVLMTYITLYFLRHVLRRMGHKDAVPWSPPFRYWRLPRYYVWVFVATRLLAFSLSLVWDHHYLSMASVNLELVFIYGFFIQGLAVTWFYFDNWKVPKIIRVVLFLLLIQPRSWIMLALSFFGMLDAWFDFRKIGGGI